MHRTPHKGLYTLPLFYLICLPLSSGSQGSEVSQTTTLCLLLTTPPLA